MRLIIAGSREINLKDYQLEAAISNIGKRIDVVVCGMCEGPDLAGKAWAHRCNVTVWQLPAPWDAYGKPAGYRRNEMMSRIAHAALLFWDGKSPGTEHMKNIMEKAGKPVYLVLIP